MDQEQIALKAAADLLHEFWKESGQDDFIYEDLGDDQWLEIVKVYSAAQPCDTITEDIVEALAYQPDEPVKLFIKRIYDRSDDVQAVDYLSEILVSYNKECLSDHIESIFQDRVEREREMGDLANE